MLFLDDLSLTPGLTAKPTRSSSVVDEELGKGPDFEVLGVMLLICSRFSLELAEKSVDLFKFTA